jgi:hypothetical protein
VAASGALRQDEVVSTSVEIRATAEEVQALVSDPTRFPEWSPECVRCAWIDEQHFKGWNRRRFGRWSTLSRVVDAGPDAFSFVVVIPALGGDLAQWTYRVAPGAEPGSTRLSEEVRMCQDLPWGVRVFERLAFGVRDRRTDLRLNLEQSLGRVRELLEGTR